MAKEKERKLLNNLKNKIPKRRKPRKKKRTGRKKMKKPTIPRRAQVQRRQIRRTWK